MKVEVIEKLLTQYYEGNTSESEEETLKAYFTNEEAPAHLQADKDIFLGLYNNAQPEVPIGLEEELGRMIDAKAVQETKNSTSRRLQAKRNWRWIGSIAASLVLLIGIGYAIKDFRSEPAVLKDTFSDPQEAYAVLQATLVEVSLDLNSGVNQVQEIQDEFQEINRQIIQSIE